MKLAFKPLYYDLVNGSVQLMPTTVPEYILPGVNEYTMTRKVTAATCSLGHTPPHPDCTCGIAVTLDPKVVTGVIQAAPEMRLIIASFQLMGEAVRENYNLRVSRVMLYSVLLPPVVEGCTRTQFVLRLADKYRPVIHNKIQDFYYQVVETWKGA